MRIPALCLAVGVVLAAGCASTPAPAPPPAAPAFDPVGAFDFATSVEGQTIAGVIRISRTDSGGLTGSVFTEVTGELPLPTVAVEGTTVRLSGNTPDGPVQMNLQFNGPEFSGNWTLGGMAGAMNGRRRS
jgi:hypothetical protein